jgi:ketosteroid isomerase-like protein
MEDIRSQIASANQNFMDAFSRSDAAGVAALYTDDTKLLPPELPMMSGKQAVQTFWQGAMDMGIKAAKLETLEIGRFTLTIQPEGGVNTTLTGKYVVVWKNQDGNWKLHIDIWNTDAP